MFNMFDANGREISSGCRIMLLLLTLTSSFSSAAKFSDIFSEHKMTVPFTVNQPVRAANVLHHPGIELLVSGIDEKHQRKLAIYGVDIVADGTESFKILDIIDIPDSFFGYDLGAANQDGLQQVYFLSKTTISKYIPAQTGNANKLHTEQTVQSMYLSDSSDLLEHLHFVEDLNDDGKDDFFLPYFEFVNLWLSDCCSHRHPQQLAIAASLQLKHSQFRYDDVDLYFQDMDQDGKTDIVHLANGQLVVHLQNHEMQFSTPPIFIALGPLVFAREWWDITDSNGQELDQSYLTHRKIDTVRDINGDQIPDLVIKYTQSSGVLDKTIDYEFYYGSVKEGVLSYPAELSTKVSSSDTLTDLKFVDLQQDGQLEVFVSSFDIGVSQVIGALLSGSIDQDSMIFAMDDNHMFAEKPIVDQEVELTFSLSSGTRGEPLVKVMDVNGDDFKDIVFSNGTDELKVLYATPTGKRAFSRRAEKQKVQLPKNGIASLVKDINRDGKSDLVVHFGPADGLEQMRQITILLAK